MEKLLPYLLPIVAAICGTVLLVASDYDTEGMAMLAFAFGWATPVPKAKGGQA